MSSLIQLPTFGPLGVFALQVNEARLQVGESGAGVVLQQEPDRMERVGPNVAGRIREHLGQILLGELLVVDLVGEAERIVEPAGGEAQAGLPPMDDVLLHVRRLVHPNGAV